MADAKIVISAVDKTKAAFDSVKSSIGGINGALAGLGLGISIGGLAVMVKDAANFADEMGKAAQKVGTTSAALSGLKYAADLSGVSFEQLQTGMAKLAKTSEDFRDGSKSAVEAFGKIGLDPSQFRDTSALLTAVADQFARMPDGAQKTAIAMELFGKAGAQLIPLLNEGAAGLEEFRQEAEKFGVIVDDEAAAAAERFNDNIDRMSTAVTGLKMELANQAIPALADITQSMVAATKQAGILNGVLVGMREAWAYAFGLDADTALKESAKKVEKRIIEINSLLANGGMKRTASGIVPMEESEINALMRERVQLAKQLGGVQDLINPKPSQGKKPTPDAPDSPLASAKKSGKTASGKSEAEQMADDYKKLIDSFNQAVAPTQTLSDKLAAQLEIYRNLDPGVRAYLQGLIDQAKASEQAAQAAQSWNDMISLQQASDDAALADLEAISAAEADHVSSLEKRAKAYRELLDPQLKLLDTQAELNEMVEAGILTSEDAAEALKKLGETSDETKSIAKDLGLTFSSAFEDAIVGGKKFSDVLKSLGDDIMRILVRRTITEPLDEGISGLLKGSGISDGIGSFFSDLFGGFRAAGGPVNVGKAYVVGERGPELFMPSTPGSIVPNGGMGGGGVVVNLIESPGNGGQVSSATDTNGMTTIDIMVEQIESKMNRNISRGTGIAPTLEGMYGLNRAVGAYR